MQNVSCPGCGAQVQFRSHASVMAVCEYCKTTVLKDADSVKNLGKMSDVLEDYSPIQIGTTGTFGSQGFGVIGRIQLRYSAGLWNEWYILFDDGHGSWLSDASGQYTLTNERPGVQPTPAFSQLAPARSYPIGETRYIAADIRTADCIGGQGELPFKVGQGWQARVADMRSGSSFLTLDYSDSEEPTVYTGQAVTLEELHCQLLRDDDTVQEGSAKFKGKVAPLNCPACGSSVSYLPGLTTHIVCPSCHAQVDTTATVAQVLAAGDRMATVHTTLALGAQATINGKQFELIGVLRQSDDEQTEWTEYLLHNARAGFLWLVETDDGWSRSMVQDEWPNWSEGGPATLGNHSFGEKYDYRARVTFAAGAFNWRVNVGDSTRIIEFENGQTGLAAEISAEEMTWSMSSPVAADQIRAWFGPDIDADKDTAESGVSSLAGKFIIGLLAVNAIPLLMSFGSTWLYVLFGLAAIYLPAKFLDSLGESNK